MDKKWLSKAAVLGALAIVILCTIFVLDASGKGIVIPDRVWGLLGVGLAMLFGISLPTPTSKA